MTNTPYIVCVNCVDREKPKSATLKNHFYVLNVENSAGEKWSVRRSYTSFFDLKAQLKEELQTQHGVKLPDLPVWKFIERGWIFGSKKAATAKRLKIIQSFCEKVLKLQEKISRGPIVTSFFEEWDSDHTFTTEKNLESLFRSNLEEKLTASKSQTLPTEPVLRNKRKGSWSLLEPPAAPSNLTKKALRRLQKSRSVELPYRISQQLSNEASCTKPDSAGSKDATAATSDVSSDSSSQDYAYQAIACGAATMRQAARLAARHKFGRSQSLEALNDVLTTHDCELRDTETQHYVCAHAYGSRHAGEVDLAPGDLVDVIEKNLSGWWFVHVEERNRQGWAPASYLRPIKRKTSRNTPQDETSEEESRRSVVKIVQACKDYESQNADEISYHKGDIVEVIQSNMDGWWKVRHRGKVGLTPATNLEEILLPFSNSEEKSECRQKRVNRVKLSHKSSIFYRNPPPRTKDTNIPIYAELNKENIARRNNAPVIKDVLKDTKLGRRRSSGVQYSQVCFPNSPTDKITSEIPPVEYSTIIPRGRIQSETDKTSQNTPKTRQIEQEKPVYMNVLKTDLKAVRNTKLEDSNTQLYIVSRGFKRKTNELDSLDAKPGSIVKALKRKDGKLFVTTVTKSDSGHSSSGWIPENDLEPLNNNVNPVNSSTNSHMTHNVTESPNIAMPGITNSFTCVNQIYYETERRPGNRVTDTVARVYRSTPSLSRSPPDSPTEYTPPSETTSTEVCFPKTKKNVKKPKSSTKLVEAIADFDSGGIAGGLSFSKGTVGVFMERSDKGWWRVNIEGHSGWVPGDYWQLVTIGSDNRSVVMSKGVLDTDSTRELHKTEEEVDCPGLVGQMTRAECEQFLSEGAGERDFVVRKSTNRDGDFTISVLFDNRVRHFCVRRTPDRKFNIGNHNFTRLASIIDYYQKHVLFYDDRNKAVTLNRALHTS